MHNKRNWKLFDPLNCKGYSRCDQHVRLAGGSFPEVSSHLQSRLMQSSHGGESGDTHMLILLARED